MQHFKLQFNSLTFLHKGNFRDLDYQQLDHFARDKTNKSLGSHFYEYSFGEKVLIVRCQQDLDEVKRISQGSSCVKLVLKQQQSIHLAQCAVCGQSPILNVRYKCVICPTDFCEGCFLQHADEHPLLMLSTPQQELMTKGIFKKSAEQVWKFFKSSLCKSQQIKQSIVQNFSQITQSFYEQKAPEIQPLSDKLRDRILLLTEIFEGNPEEYRFFVIENEKLSDAELIEKASCQFG